MAAPKGKKQWTSDNETARQLMYVEGLSDQQVHDEKGIGWPTINKVREMVEAGTAPLLGPPLEPGGNISQEIFEGTEKVTAGGKAETKKRESAQTAPSFEQSNLLRIVPRSFTTSSLTVWLAMQVAQKVWGWKVTDPGEFIDRFITTAMEDYGITLASYSVQPGVETINQGNGKGEQDEMVEEAEEIVFTGEET